MNDGPDTSVDTIWEFLSLRDEGIRKETAATWLLVGLDTPPEVLSGVPDVIAVKEDAVKLVVNIENETGILAMEQVDGAERHGWLHACKDLKPDGFTYAECLDLFADAAMLLRGDGIKLNGTEIDTVFEALDSVMSDEERRATAAVSVEALASGARELGVLAPPRTAFKALVVATARLEQATKHPLEELIDEGNGKMDLLNDELELVGAFRSKKPMRPLSDDELEVYERASGCVGVPRRGKQVPFATDRALVDTILHETVRCWYTKTLSDMDDVTAPSVLDEIVANLRVPKKSEGQDVGDPMGILADAAFALYARLGPLHPHLTPASLLVLWMCTMEGADIDRLMKFNDVPPVKETLQAGPDTIATTAGTGEEYGKRYAGRRNPGIVQEIALAQRGIKDTSCIPTSAIMLTLTTLDGLNSTYMNESIYLEVQVKGSNAQTSETRPYSHSINFSQVIIVPQSAPVVTLRITVHATSGKYVGQAETKYPPEGAAQQRLPITPAELRVRSSAKLATISINMQKTELDRRTMADLLESLGGDAQKQWAQDKLTKWVKVSCALQALQARSPLPVSRSMVVPSAIVQQHASLTQGAWYTWLAPTVASHGDAAAPPADGSNALVFHSSGTPGIDVSQLSYYPEEKTVIASPFAAHTLEKVDGKGPVTVTMAHSPAAPEGGVVVGAALRRFYHACLADLARADEQLKAAQDRNWIERSRHLVQLVTDGDLRCKLRDEKAVHALPTVQAMPDHLHERLHDRLAPIPPGINGSNLPRGQTPLAFCTARATVSGLLSELILMWFDKEGDVLDELMENLVLPDEASALTLLSSLSAVLAEHHSDEQRNWAEILVLVLLTLESYDVDRICLLSGTPPASASLAEKEEYVLDAEVSRNVSVLHTLSMALASMADYQLSATLAANASEAKRAALVEPYKAAKEVVGKWIKVLGLCIAMCGPCSSELMRCATPAPGETERIQGIEPGMWGLWAAPSMCTKEETPIQARKGALKVKYTVRGVVEALDLSPYRQQHCPWDTSPAIMLPPLVSYLVGDVQRSEGEVSIELFTRDVLSTSHPAIRKWREAIQYDCGKADARLKEAFHLSVKAKEREMRKRNEVSLGKRVVLPSVETVHTKIETQKEYRYLLYDEVLPGHCNHASVGLVGNVTEAVVTTVSDLRRSIRELAAEMRGEELEAEYTKPPPKVVSVTFDDGSIYLFPTDLLQVHPVTWMPRLPSTLRIIIRWCDVREGVKGAHTRMQVEDVTKVTDAPLNDQVSFASVSEIGSQGGNYELPVKPGNPAMPVWEETFHLELDKVKLAERPLELAFTVFAEPPEEEMDEYDYIVKDLNDGEDESIVGLVSLSLHYHILMETVGKQREFPLALRYPRDTTADHVTTLLSAEDPAQMSPGTLHVALQLVENTRLLEEEAKTDVIGENADPLSWRVGEYASDRICTACDVGGEEYTEAHYVCAQCDAKLCDECWDMDHKDPKKHDHLKLLLYHHCDFCFVDQEAGGDSSTPALWFCSECDLNLCKGCWYDEHKHPQRRKHDRDFLYPDGEDGAWAAATVLSQTVTYHTERFFSDAVSFKGNRLALCGVCNEKDAVYSWPTPFDRGEGFSGLLLCEEHMQTQKHEHDDEIAEAEANNLPLPPPRPRPTLLIDACYLCAGLEDKPASYMCEECGIPLCARCWKSQHNHPRRRSHKRESVVPKEAYIEGTSAYAMMREVEDAVVNLASAATVEEPETKPVRRGNEAEVWRAKLREQEAGIKGAVEVADLQQQRDDRARARAAKDGEILTKHSGYISGGGDIGVSQRLTLKEAKELCLSMPHCKGFTFKQEPHSAKVRVFFKDKWNLQGKNKGWVSYHKEEAPVIGLCSHGALKAYCGRCREEQKRRPLLPQTTNVPGRTDPSLEAKLAGLIWDADKL